MKGHPSRLRLPATGGNLIHLSFMRQSIEYEPMATWSRKIKGVDSALAIARFFNMMRDATGTPEAPLPETCRTVSDALGHLSETFPKLRNRLVHWETGAVRDGMVVLLDGRKVAPSALADTPLPSESEISFFEIIGGG